VHVAVGRVTLHLAENHSLKGKRQVVRSLVARVRQRFNVAVAEVGEPDLWQVAVLGLCCVSNSPGAAGQLLAEATRFIEAEALGQAEVVDVQTEVLPGVL
jgi:uncharacterized protein YlxP (DUF503 family)